jgi:hypothetical protein
MVFSGSLSACAAASPDHLQRVSNGGSGSPVSGLTDLLEVSGLVLRRTGQPRPLRVDDE